MKHLLLVEWLGLVSTSRFKLLFRASVPLDTIARNKGEKESGMRIYVHVYGKRYKSYQL